MTHPSEQAERVVNSCTHTKRSDCSACIFCIKDALLAAEARGRASGLEKAFELIKSYEPPQKTAQVKQCVKYSINELADALRARREGTG